MKEGLIKDAYELIIKEVQTLITIAYLFMVAIGMLFNYHKYAEFGINIFQYADVFDFLIAPFADPKIFFFALFSILVPVLLLRFDFFMEKRFPKFYSKMNFGWNKKPWFKKYRMVAFCSVFIVYAYVAADSYGKRASEIIIEDQKTIQLKFLDNQIINGTVIGKTSQALFFLDKKGKVKIIPFSSMVKEIEVSIENE